ncbi:MAG TPA: hypothetical protein VGR85_08985 [Candidatus Limnocylindria bacterium]|jgi:hypothetical protein|nr:hypothetical protein [Candidatus Limnocylindria bacterium]
MPLLRALYERIPKLAARETLRMTRATALGSGNMRKGDHAAAWRDLLRQAGFTPPRRLATPENLRRLGIAVK